MMWRVVTFISLGAAAGFLGTWVAERQPPTEIIATKVLTPIVNPGAELKIRYAAFRTRSCRTRFQRTYRDGENTRFVLEDIDIWMSPSPLGHDEYVSAIPISVKAVAGQASFRAVNIYICNPLHYIWPIIQVTPMIPFEIQGEPIGGAIEITPRR